MKNIFLEFINRHERAKVIWTVLKNNNNSDLRKRILDEDYLTVSIKDLSAGKALKGIPKILYRIEIGTWGDGFFAEYRRLLNYLYYCEVFGFIPYIHFNKDFTYAEKKPVNGTDNPFEYYFRQPCMDEQEALQYCYCVKSRLVDCEFANRLKPLNGYDVSEEYIAVMAKISEKYIKFNSPTEQYLSQAEELIHGKKMLGVHVRLTDFKQNYWGHPVCATADCHLEYAKKALEELGFEGVFLATDDEETVELFKDEFGGKLFYYQDVVRSSGQVSVAFSSGTRENHHYKLGLEVIRDMYTLSLCQGLIAGKSQVSICAMIEKQRKSNYEYIHIIDKGNNNDPSKKYSNVKAE